MATASGVPARLYHYADQTTRSNDAAVRQVTRLANAIQAYRQGTIGAGADIPYLTSVAGPGGGYDLAELISQTLTATRATDQKVHGVGTAFEAINRQRLRRPAPGANPYADTLANAVGDAELDLYLAGQGADPTQVKKWWDGLAPADRQLLADTDPERVGTLDGIPVAARDYANRKVLADLVRTTSGPTRLALLQLQAKLPALPTSSTDYNAAGFPTTAVPAEWQRTFLLGVDTGGNGHMTVATNNPDAAKNVVTWVSGVGTKLDQTNVGYALGIPQAVARSAGGSTSVIAWMNYDAPAGIDRQALDTADAKAAAPALLRFQQGLTATHDPGTPAHNVLLGHSYGSAVIGETARAAGPGGLSRVRVDDVISVGSPGMDVGTAKDLGVPAGHVYASRAVDDPIPYVTAVAAKADPHGPDPTSDGFGARVFDAGSGGSPLDAHGSYFNTGPALTNIGRIVSGNGGAITAPTPQEIAAIRDTSHLIGALDDNSADNSYSGGLLEN